MKPQPLFPSPLANYLTAAEVMIVHGSTHQRALAEQDTTLTPEWLLDFRQRITQTRNEVLGADNKGEQRQATIDLNELADDIKPQLKSVMNIVENKFIDQEAAEGQELLNLLGYKQWWRRATRNQSQSALVELLKEFEANLTPQRRARLEAKGANPAHISAILEYAVLYDQQNISQEAKKGASTLLTASDIEKVNAIHKDLRIVMDAAANAFRKNPRIRALFALSRLMNEIDGTRRNRDEDNPTA